ncbi:dihydroorotate dehydrogenase-like protein [Pseudomonas sp. C27(2019)]|uniref:dihydroorotate dehydrogenase-like protein n=1 Tax=Pseudomonas sp. C27(2019) TaxID=2604941 RepID=UPI00124787FD|nr:dihydroorotate dehydrogenase-like protein [Pseudomonas sp. C27(2019)]QEY58605.1 dihydroorotate dehydrogenase-like protein [Pseudomonas sp. C27(2019)]
MIDLSTEYLGLKLKNPLVPSSSPLTGDLDSARELEDAGASALILPSLFEESILASEAAAVRFLHEQDIGFGEAGSFLPMPDESLYRSELDEYLHYIQTLKNSLSIPVIASLNGISTEGWTGYGKQLQEAGADALELNVYYVAADMFESGAEVEARYINVLRELKQHVTLPITMKLSSQFSSVGHFVRSLQDAGAQGVSLFNRFYQPDIDLLTREVVPTLSLSSSYESLLRVHWVATLFGKVDLSLAVTGGMHSATDVMKALMAGADVTHLCSVLLKQGPQALAEIEQSMREWMAQHEYQSVQQLKGSVCRDKAIDPSAYDRANYVQVMHSHRSARGVWR